MNAGWRIYGKTSSRTLSGGSSQVRVDSKQAGSQGREQQHPFGSENGSPSSGKRGESSVDRGLGGPSSGEFGPRCYLILSVESGECFHSHGLGISKGGVLMTEVRGGRYSLLRDPRVATASARRKWLASLRHTSNTNVP